MLIDILFVLLYLVHGHEEVIGHFVGHYGVVVVFRVAPHKVTHETSIRPDLASCLVTQVAQVPSSEPPWLLMLWTFTLHRLPSC